MPTSLPLRLVALNSLVQKLTQPKYLAIWFLLCALPAGLGCALLTPVGLFADEVFHVARADGLSHGEIFGQMPPPGFAPFPVNTGVKIDNGLLAVLFAREDTAAFPDKPLPAAVRHLAEEMPWFAGTAYYPTQMVAYAPVMYVPAAVGLATAKALEATPLHAFFFGRVAMFLAYLALGTAALALTRYGQGLLFALLTLPASVDLAASYNQDGLIFACCALAVALLTRAGPWLNPGPNQAWGAALVLFSAVLCAKPPYAPLLLLWLLPLRGVWLRLGWVLAACVPPGLWLAHLSHAGFVAYQVPPYQPGPLWPGPRGVWLHDMMPGHNMQVLMAHPAQILRLPLVSLGRLHGNWLLLLGRIGFDNSRIAAWEYLAAGRSTRQFGHWRCPGPGRILAPRRCRAGADGAVFRLHRHGNLTVSDLHQSRDGFDRRGADALFCPFPAVFCVSAAMGGPGPDPAGGDAAAGAAYRRLVLPACGHHGYRQQLCFAGIYFPPFPYAGGQ